MNFDEAVELRLAELLADRSGKLSDLAINLRRFVVKQVPDCSELLYQTYAVSSVFSFTGKLGQAFLHIATYANHTNLGFNQGALLNDKTGLLKGTGKQIRHIRIDSLQVAKQKGVAALIQQAAELGSELADKAGGVQRRQFIDKSIRIKK